MVNVSLKKLKGQFFDRQSVRDLMTTAEIEFLSAFGAVVRTTAKQSMKSREGVSPPGTPPYSHAGQLRGLIYFAMDATSLSVVIGPTLFSEAKTHGNERPVPALHEYGGVAWRDGKKRQYPARPFMGPAFREWEGKTDEIWAIAAKYRRKKNAA